MKDSGVKVPYIFVADDAFGLKPHMMKPYSEQELAVYFAKFIFDYTLSRARRIMENPFGIMASRFRMFRRPMIANVKKACAALHNFFMKTTNANSVKPVLPCKLRR